MTMTTSSSNPTFADLVELDVRGSATPAQREALRRPENREAWKAELQRMRDSLDSRIDAAEANMARTELDPPPNIAEIRVDHTTWLAKVRSFRKFVEAAKREADKLGAADNASRLMTAINRHRANVMEHYEPNPVDFELWAAADEII